MKVRHVRTLLTRIIDKPGFMNRWGPEAWFVWFMGGNIPSFQNKHFLPEGYRFEEVGPYNMKNKGAQGMEAWEEKLKAERPAGCPFAFAK